MSKAVSMAKPVGVGNATRAIPDKKNHFISVNLKRPCFKAGLQNFSVL